MDYKADQNTQQQQQSKHKRCEIEQFLYDVRAHFRASLESSEYENASNLFHVTAADQTEHLLERCELLLQQYPTSTQPIENVLTNCVDTSSSSSNSNNNHNHNNSRTSKLNDGTTTTTHNDVAFQHSTADIGYMEMTSRQQHLLSPPSAFVDKRNSTLSDKTFRNSLHMDGTQKSIQNMLPIESELKFSINDDDDPQIYDICQVSSQLVVENDNDDDETQKAISPDLELAHAIDCPYMELPAGHLAIQHSTKYGQLQRIEKRLFFDQSKKCYCGVLNDWMLCYVDGPTSSQPSITLHLKSPGIEIEHFGEGKRREICFQITTADPSKKFVFQAINEVDAKEWIHAIEAAIRGNAVDATTTTTTTPTMSIMKLSRKLPTPPVMKKITFVGVVGDNRVPQNATQMQHDCIYEEPSPLYHCADENSELLNAKQAPLLPIKQFSHSTLANRFEYDVPKIPAQPLELLQSVDNETADLFSSNESTPKSPIQDENTTQKSLDFQTKVKDLHQKLSSQLSAGPKKALKKTYSGSSNDSETLSLTNSPTAPVPSKEQKKQKKTNTPNTSPQKPLSKDSEKSAKNWFLNRLNKNSNNNNTTVSSNSSGGVASTRTTNFNGNNGSNNFGCCVGNTPNKTKCKQSEKENLLNSLDTVDNNDSNNVGGSDMHYNNSSNPTSPCLKSECKSKVNMIINQFESSGHLATMFSVEALAANALASLTSLCDNDCNNYEPIMNVSTTPNSFMKKV